MVLFVVALVVFGPQKLPELARMLGKATAEFRKMTGDFRFALEEEVRDLDRQTRIREIESASANSIAPEGTIAHTSVPAEPPVPEAPAISTHGESEFVPSQGHVVDPAAEKPSNDPSAV